MLAVVGGMLNQDAADSLRTGKDQEGNTYNTFDPKSLIDFQAENSPGITEGYYQQYNGDQLASALEGDWAWKASRALARLWSSRTIAVKHFGSRSGALACAISALV